MSEGLRHFEWLDRAIGYGPDYDNRMRQEIKAELQYAATMRSIHSPKPKTRTAWRVVHGAGERSTFYTWPKASEKLREASLSGWASVLEEQVPLDYEEVNK